MLRRLAAFATALAALALTSPASAGPKPTKLDASEVVIPDMSHIGPAAPSGQVRLWAGQLYDDGVWASFEGAGLRSAPHDNFIGMGVYGAFEIVYPMKNARGKDLRLTCKGAFKPEISVKTLGFDSPGVWDEGFSNTTVYPTKRGSEFVLHVPAHDTESDYVSLELRSYIPEHKSWAIRECVIDQVSPFKLKKGAKPIPRKLSR